MDTGDVRQVKVLGVLAMIDEGEGCSAVFLSCTEAVAGVVGIRASEANFRSSFHGSRKYLEV